MSLMQHESESMANATTQGTGSTQTPGPIDQDNEEQLMEMGGDMADAEIVTKTNVQLSELPLSLDDIQSMIFDLA